MANWTSRGLVPAAVLVTTPKFLLFEVQHVVFGGANCVRLKMLKNYVRNSNPKRPSRPNIVLLNKEKSKLLIPCARSWGSTRGSSPNVKSAGAVKHAVLNHLGALKSFGLPSREL